jgi:hypothetical protein
VRQIGPFCTLQPVDTKDPEADQNGGSVRGYLGVAGPLSSPGMAYWMVACSVYFSLSHKRRASMGADVAPGIMVYAAEFPVSAA